MNSSKTCNPEFDNATLGAMHASFDMTLQQQVPLHPVSPDLLARRSISDSMLSTSRQYQFPSTYGNLNTTYMMVNRSGGKTVKTILSKIREACEAQEGQGWQQQQPVVPPEHECCIIAQWAADTYYRVVIASNDGIPLVIRAMRAFRSDRGLQECCCLALSNLCLNGRGNVMAIENSGGIAQIICAMKDHTTSVAVQSAACDALRNLSGLVLIHSQLSESQQLMHELAHALSNAKQMYLHPSHKSMAQDLLQMITTNAPPTY